jgi:hypothetical protein
MSANDRFAVSVCHRKRRLQLAVHLLRRVLPTAKHTKTYYFLTVTPLFLSC